MPPERVEGGLRVLGGELDDDAPAGGRREGANEGNHVGHVVKHVMAHDHVGPSRLVRRLRPAGANGSHVDPDVGGVGGGGETSEHLGALVHPDELPGGRDEAEAGRPCPDTHVQDGATSGQRLDGASPRWGRGRYFVGVEQCGRETPW